MFNLFKTARWNREVAQAELAALILEAATTDDYRKQMAAEDRVFELRKREQWSFAEAADRCVHAASMIKISHDRETYNRVVVVSKRLYLGLLA